MQKHVYSFGTKTEGNGKMKDTLGGKGAGDRFAIHGAVTERARRREAERACLDRLAHDHRHARDVVGARRLVARTALAHDIGAHGAVWNLHADIDRVATLFERVEVLRGR